MFDIHIIPSRYLSDYNSDELKIYGLPCIPFTKRMTKGLMRGKTMAIIAKDRQELSIEMPQKGALYYIGEPFKRRFGWSNGTRKVYSIQYLADKEEVFFDDGMFQKVDQKTEVYQPEAMLENESRFYIRIESCGYRKLGTLKLAECIHNNLYESRKTHYVYVIQFQVLSQRMVDRIITERLRGELFD